MQLLKTHCGTDYRHSHFNPLVVGKTQPVLCNTLDQARDGLHIVSYATAVVLKLVKQVYQAHAKQQQSLEQ